MAGKFAQNTRPRVQSPVSTVPGSHTVTALGGPARSRDPKSDLFLLAVSNMVGEETFHEDAFTRDDRFRALARQVSLEDPSWVAGFVPFLRTEMFMRSASVVLACEYAAARKGDPRGPSIRSVIDSACGRLDEPSEVLAYWQSQYGRSVPSAVKRALSDALARLCNERSAIKYDGDRRNWRLGDVIEVVHAKPSAPWQSDLYRWLLDRRRHPDALPLTHALDDGRSEVRLPTVQRFTSLRTLPVATQRAHLLEDPERLRECGLTWEYLSGLGPMDAAAWTAVIPSMGYMALLRNLRNFDEAGVSDAVAAQVCARLADPEQVARSKQFPYRFLSAYLAAPSLRWSYALDKALDLSVLNVPDLPGRTLVLVDTSASMTSQGVSRNSKVVAAQVAALFGVTLARRSGDRVDLHGFADGTFQHRL